MNREVVQLEPCYVLHQRPYRDSSRLLDVFSREHGRVSLVARGVRRPRSKLRSVLMPFQPIFVSWVRRTELGTLTAAEAAGAPLALRGDGVLAGYYLNELLLRLLETGETHSKLFQRGGAPWFFVLLALSILILLFVPPAWAWLRSMASWLRGIAERRRARKEAAKKSPAPEPGAGGGAVTATILFIALTLSSVSAPCLAVVPAGFEVADSVVLTPSSNAESILTA